MFVIDLFLLIIYNLQYADPVADLLDRWGVFRVRLFRESCVFHRGNYVKDLNKLGRDLQKVIIVDNSPASYIFHPDNAVRIHFNFPNVKCQLYFSTLFNLILFMLRFLWPRGLTTCKTQS